ncbi:MAG: ABC transporter permease [Clostridiales bacterium]|nr:ABC transporter permease [Clostridiales bacterium]
MKQFSTILSFELKNYLKSKAFLIITILLVAVIGIVLSFPRLSEMWNSGEGGTVTPGEKPLIALKDDASADEAGKEASLAFFRNAMSDKRFELTDKSEDELIADVDAKTYASAIILTSPTEYKYIVKDVVMYDDTSVNISGVLLAKYQQDAMLSHDLTLEQAWEILSAKIIPTVIQTGKDQFANFFYTYIMLFLLYMALLIYGQMVASSVASEKSSRAMELLITSAKPTNLMFGKVLGTGLAGLLQLALILGSAFVFFHLNSAYWENNEIVRSIFDIPLSVFFYILLFFVLGYFIYSFLYGAVGSLVNRAEEVNTMVMPVTFFCIIAFMIVMISTSFGKIDSTLMVICSYIPFTSPMAMFVRITMSTVPAWEVILSVAILIASTIGIAYLAAGIYKMGVLLYGKPPKPGEMIKMLRRS